MGASTGSVKAGAEKSSPSPEMREEPDARSMKSSKPQSKSSAADDPDEAGVDAREPALRWEGRGERGIDQSNGSKKLGAGIGGGESLKDGDGHCPNMTGGGHGVTRTVPVGVECVVESRGRLDAVVGVIKSNGGTALAVECA